MLTVAIDLNGVIYQTWPHKVAWLRARGYEIPNTPSISTTQLQSRFGHDLIAAMQWEIYTSQLPCLPGAISAVQELAKIATIIFLPRRHVRFSAATWQWLQQQSFADCVETIVFQDDPHTFDKLHWCETHHVDVLIDDMRENLHPALAWSPMMRWWITTESVPPQSPIHTAPSLAAVVQSLQQSRLREPTDPIDHRAADQTPL